MSRKPPRDDEQRIDSNIVAIAHIARSKPFGGYCDATESVAIERPCGSILSRPSLHFDEGESSAAPCNNVNFAAWYPHTAGEDSPAFQP